jgi:N-acetylglutamate synthase-like GNAT family acetyltransferase
VEKSGEYKPNIICARRKEVKQILEKLSFTSSREACFFVEEFLEIFRDFEAIDSLRFLDLDLGTDFISGEDFLLSQIIEKIGLDENFRNLLGREKIGNIWFELVNRYYDRLEEKGEADGPVVGLKSCGVGDIWENLADDFNDGVNLDEIIMLNRLIQHIAPYTGDRKVADKIIQFITVFRELVTKYAGNALSQIDAQYSAGRLLDVIRSAKYSGLKEDAARVLYRLELGQMPISAQGVEYLGRLYDLGEQNNPGHFARRLTAEGDIGIFDEEKKLTGYFQLGDLSSVEKSVKAEVFKFAYETLFVGMPDETEEERTQRMVYLAEFQENYFSLTNDEIFEQTGVRLNNLSFKEQGWFLIYYNKATEGEKQRLKLFLQKFGEDGLKTFFALEADSASGEAILAIGEKLDANVAEPIFNKFNEIANIVHKIRQQVAEIFGNDADSFEADLSTIATNTLKRGCALLKRFAQLANTADTDETTLTQNTALAELQHMRADVILFAASFKQAVVGHKMDFEEIKGLDFESKDSSKLSEDERAEMERIFVANRPGYTSELLAKMREDFNHALNSEGKRFYIVSHDGAMVSFMRFNELENGNTYFGSFNVRPEARGSSIGLSFLKTVIEKEGAKKTLEAVVYVENPILRHYLDDFGFKIIEELEDFEGTGKKFYKIQRGPKVINLSSKQQEVLPDLNQDSDEIGYLKKAA